MSEKLKDLKSLGKVLDFETTIINPKRGEIYIVDLSDMAIGTVHIHQKKRPALIISNDIGNHYAPIVNVALISSSVKKEYPMHQKIKIGNNDSIIMFEQILTLDKNRLLDKIAELTYEQMLEAEQKLMYSLQLSRYSLHNVMDIEVVNQNVTKNRDGKNVNFDIDIIFVNGDKKRVNVLLDKLKKFDKDICEDIDFDELKKKLDCCRGLNWLINNNRM